MTSKTMSELPNKTTSETPVPVTMKALRIHNSVCGQVQSQSCSEASSETAAQAEETSAPEDALSGSSSRTTMPINDNEGGESQYSDTDGDDTDEYDDFDYSYNYDDDDDEESYDEYDEDYEEEELQHPRCIYQEIGTRDLDVDLKSQLPSAAGPELRDLMTNAQAKKCMLFEFRKILQHYRAPDMTQNQWDQQLSATYRRQASVLLEALEADIVYFRKVLYELVHVYYDKDSTNSPLDNQDYERERDRIHQEIGDTRANILVVRLRADRLTKKFVDKFRRKSQIKQEDWAFVDQLIPTWRTPHKRSASLSSNDCPEWMRRIEQERQKTAGEILAQWGWERARRNGRRGWLMGHQFKPLDSAFVDSFIPECLSEPLAQYLFGGACRAPQARSPQNMIPDIQLGVGTCVLAPAIENDEFLDAEGLKHTIALSSSASDKWIYKNLIGDGLPWPFSADSTFRLKEFGTRFHPRLPDRRCALFHLLINMFHVRRWEGELSDKWRDPWQDDVGEMMRGERWGLPAPWMRKSTILKMATTIGHISNFSAEFEAGIETNNVCSDGDAELDMLITNIIEEHLFPSPAVVFPDESKFERLVFGEADIVAQMQRRKAHFQASSVPGATVKCVFAHKMTTYWCGKGLELNIHR